MYAGRGPLSNPSKGSVVRFLANENIPFSAVRFLQENGKDVVWVGDVLRGATDDSVLERAQAEGRVILTFDRDYGELVFLHGQGRTVPGVIYFRFFPDNPETFGRFVLHLLGLSDIHFERMFTVVEPRGIRQRPL